MLTHKYCPIAKRKISEAGADNAASCDNLECKFLYKNHCILIQGHLAEETDRMLLLEIRELLRSKK